MSHEKGRTTYQAVLESDKDTWSRQDANGCVGRRSIKQLIGQQKGGFI